MRMRTCTLALGLWTFLAPSPALAGWVLFGKSKVSFTAVGSPGAMSFEGRTSDITLAQEGETLRFTVPVDTITTGIDLRDKHMRETYVQSATFPTFVLELPAAQVQLPAAGKAEGTVQATFSAHGVAAPVEVKWNAEKSGQGWKIKASFPFDVGAHGIAIPSYLGVTIDKAMKASVQISVAQEP